MFESDVWPTLKICHECWRAATQFIIDTGRITNNPLLVELLRGTDNGVRESSLRYWVKNPDGSFGEQWVNYGPRIQKIFEESA